MAATPGLFQAFPGFSRSFMWVFQGLGLTYAAFSILEWGAEWKPWVQNSDPAADSSSLLRQIRKASSN